MTCSVVTSAGQLRRALRLAQHITPHRIPVPVLCHVLITVGPSGARIEATNLTSWFHLDLPGRCQGDARFTLNPRHVSPLLEAAGDDALVEVVAHGEDDVRVHVGGMMRFCGAGFSPDDFPEPPAAANAAVAPAA